MNYVMMQSCVSGGQQRGFVPMKNAGSLPLRLHDVSHWLIEPLDWLCVLEGCWIDMDSTGY
jgi:hypothetical protein